MGAHAPAPAPAPRGARGLRAEGFALQKHGEYFKKHMKSMPHHYKSMDTNRLTLLYFCVSGLDLLDLLSEIDKEQVIEYIYSYMSPVPDNGGFYGYPRLSVEPSELHRCCNQPHIANTYVALVMLLILGDDLSRVNREAVAHSMRKWQLPDGSFCCVHGMSSLDSENDIRFVYCAAAICYILDLWEAVDVDGMHDFILAAQSYDMAFGMGPATESHGGCTFCAVAALSMMGRLHQLAGKEQLIDWCVKRQHFGFQGRIEKPMDSCYSFWVGASLKLLGVEEFLNGESCASFLKDCEFSEKGGFQKFPEVKAPDLLHSYFSVCGLSLCGVLQPMDARLNMSERAFKAAAGGAFQTAPGGLDWPAPGRPPAPEGPGCHLDARGPAGSAAAAAAARPVPPAPTPKTSAPLARLALVAMAMLALALALLLPVLAPRLL